MNAELKSKWVAALRGGQYQQGRGALRNNDHFCCLGVLCDVIDSSRWANDRYLVVDYEGSSEGWAYLPVSVAVAARLNFVASRTLAAMNDNGDSFAEIANWIEDNVSIEPEIVDLCRMNYST